MTDPARLHKRPDIRKVAAAALAAADRVLSHWLPAGKRNGHEYVALNPRRKDAKRGSFSVNVDKGAWSDFATGDKGGDLVALVAYLDGVNQGDAAQRLAAFLGMDAAFATASPARPVKADVGAVAIYPVPIDASPAPRTHAKHGRPSRVWTYRDAAGQVLFHVARFDLPEGKQILPLSLWREGAALRWHWKGLPQPRPLYGLDRLATRPAALVVVCEGEKDADAAGELLPDCVAITSPNGSRSAGVADWSPLAGRRVVVWPDADKPGTEYARDVVREADKAGAERAHMIDLAALATLHGRALPTGWGAADALAEGIDTAALARVVIEASNKAPTPAPKPRRATTARASPFVLVSADKADGRKPGVYYLPTFRNRQTGEQEEGAPEWICSPLRIEALTRDASGSEWGRLLVFPDRDGTEHRWAMPCAMLAKDGAELRETLLSQGLEITASQSRKYLVEYIQAAEPGRHARCATRTGWHGDVYVLPDRTIGGGSEETLVFQSATADGSKLASAGTLNAWRAEVCAPCASNSRLVLALSAAFAAPCLHLLGLEGGGLHLRGGSSCGKTTALAVAASVYGPPEYRREWRATDNALESVAAMHCDALLPLDEIGQLDPKHAAAVAYLLSNGQGKSRSRRDGSLRAPATWRLLFLSCGEVGLGDLIAEAGGRQRAGMEVRVVDIGADAGAGLGMFEQVPVGIGAGAYADRLRAAAASNYGTAFPALLEALARAPDKARNALRTVMDRLAAELVRDDAAGQVRRVAQRFALIASAGELATLNGITGWPSGEAMRAARACFAAWLDARGGPGESEPRAMLRQVQTFISLHSEGRFSPIERVTDDRAPKTLMSAGWRLETDTGREHWVFPGTWCNEVCKGFDAKEVARMLVARELLRPESATKLTRRERIRGTTEHVRVFRLLPGILDCEP